MIKSRIVKLFFVFAMGLFISCDTFNNLEQKVNEVKDGQEVILKKMASLEKALNNLALANKNKPAADKKQQPPQADPNKVYNIEVGDSFTKGPDNAAVTIIEWSDFQ